jgi:hypothetical protein
MAVKAIISRRKLTRAEKKNLALVRLTKNASGNQRHFGSSNLLVIYSRFGGPYSFVPWSPGHTISINNRIKLTNGIKISHV